MSHQSPTKLSGYSNGAIILHWLIAALILLNIAGGFFMMRITGITENARFYVFQWHKTVGILVLFLTLARIAWRLMNKPPQKAPMLKIEAFAANVVSIFFYGLMLAVPLLGWLIVSTTKVHIPTFLFLSPSLPWPHLPFIQNQTFSHLASNAHMVLAYSFVALLFLHIAGAIKHSVIDNQPEFSRMLPTKRLIHLKAKALSWPIMLLAFSLPILLGIIIAQRQTINQLQSHSTNSSTTSLSAQSDTGNWTINMDKSSISYSLDFSGSPKQGKIGNWHADVIFSPDKLESARAQITLASNSISYEDSFVAGSIADQDGLDIKNYPEIKILLDKFSRDNETYIAKGTLTIRGVSQPIEVVFSFNDENGIAKVSGNTKIERLLFGIGEQNDGDGSWLGKIINVQFSLEAEPKK